MQKIVATTDTSAEPRIIRMGRTELRTSLTELTAADIAEEMGRMFPKHVENAADANFLIEYYLGFQPYVLNREKLVRQDVDNRIVINYAKSSTRDIVGYLLGKPIRYVPRTLKKNDPVKSLSDMMDAEDKGQGDFEIAEFASICGTAFRGIFPDVVDDGTPPFELVTLDPRYTYCVYSSDPTKREPLYAVNYYTVMNNTNDYDYHFTIYTATQKHTFTMKNVPITSGWGTDFGSLTIETVPHIIGKVPIVEYPNNQWRMGDWEAAISILDAINVVGSDSVNDVVQYVNSILAVIGAELGDENMAALEKQKILNLFDIPPGVQTDVKYVAQMLDAQSITTLREYLETALRVVLGIPDRKTRGGGGGDTGDAVFMRDGWLDIDLVATNKELFYVSAERRTIGVALAIAQQKGELKTITPTDIEIKFLRSKTANLQVKAQAFGTMVGTKKISPVDALEMCDMHSDPEEVAARGREYWDAENEKAFEQQQKIRELDTKDSDDVSSDANDTTGRTTSPNSPEGGKTD